MGGSPTQCAAASHHLLQLVVQGSIDGSDGILPAEEGLAPWEANDISTWQVRKRNQKDKTQHPKGKEWGLQSSGGYYHLPQSLTPMIGI